MLNKKEFILNRKAAKDSKKTFQHNILVCISNLGFSESVHAEMKLPDIFTKVIGSILAV